ncbi:MAG: UxaA family hydrolase [Gaiellales bacterium]
MHRFLVLSPLDNVGVALAELAPGAELDHDGDVLVVRDAIPAAHKLALRSIAPGERVVKYGTPIGIATAAISPGEHVHTHNVESDRMRGDR